MIVLLPAGPSAMAAAGAPTFVADEPNPVAFAAQEAKFIRVVILATSGGQPCIDELEVYGPEGRKNLALAAGGAKATASSCLPGYPIHQIAHLNDGLYGNNHSWIAAGDDHEWAQIELPAAAKVSKIVFSRDRGGDYKDRLPLGLEVRLSLDGKSWKTAAVVKAANFPPPDRGYVAPAALPNRSPGTDWSAMPSSASERPGNGSARWTISRRCASSGRRSPVGRPTGAASPGSIRWHGPFVLMEEMTARLAAKGLDVGAERSQLIELRRRQAALAAKAAGDDAAEQALYLDARAAKRRLMFRDPDLAGLERILFVKRHPYLSSHNYSDILDSQFRPGGGSASWKSRARGAPRSRRRQARHALRLPPGNRPRCGGGLRRPAGLLRLSAQPESHARTRVLLAPDVGRRGRGRGPAVDPRAVPRLLPLPVGRRRAGLHLHPLPRPLPLLAAAGLRALPHGCRRPGPAAAVVRQSERMVAGDDARRPHPLDAIRVSRQGGQLRPHALGDPSRRHASRADLRQRHDQLLHERAGGPRRPGGLLHDHLARRRPQRPAGADRPCEGSLRLGRADEHHPRHSSALRHELAGGRSVSATRCPFRATISSPPTPRPIAGDCSSSIATAIAS